MQGEDQAWVAVDAYFAERLIGNDPLRARIREANAAQGLPPHDVSPLQGRFLSLLVKATGARRILEIGTLGGVSATWMAQALPAGGQLISLEVSPDYAALARQNLDRAGIGDRVQILVGPALESLARLDADACPAFDLVFIDAEYAGVGQHQFEAGLDQRRLGQRRQQLELIQCGFHAGDAECRGRRRRNPE